MDKINILSINIWLHLIFIKENLPQLVWHCLAKLLEAKKPHKCYLPTRNGAAGIDMDTPQDLFQPFPR